MIWPWKFETIRPHAFSISGYRWRVHGPKITGVSPHPERGKGMNDETLLRTAIYSLRSSKYKSSDVVPDFFILTPSFYVFQSTLSMSHFVITGGTGGTTAGAAAPNRLEINTLIQNPKQFSLYIQALSKTPSRKS